MSSVTTSLVNTNVKITWSAPSNNNGLSVTAYKIKIL